MKKIHPDVLASVLLFIVGVAIVVMSKGLPSAGLSRYGPGFFPSITGYGLAIVSLILLVEAIRKKKTADTYMDRKSLTDIIILLAVVLVYSFMLRPLGYIISTVLFLAAILYIFGYRNYIKLGIIALIVPTSIYLLFVQLLSVPLP